MRFTLLVVAVLGLILACGSSSSEPTPVVLHPTASASAKIGAAGGEVSVGALRLEIPAGALDQEVTITVTELGGPTALAFELEPAGTKFKTPAIGHVTLPQGVLAKVPANSAIGGIAALGDDAGNAEYTTATTEGPPRVRVNVPHFSWVVVYPNTFPVDAKLLSPESMNVALGAPFSVVGSYTRTSSPVTFYQSIVGRDGEYVDRPFSGTLTATLVRGHSNRASVAEPEPVSWGVLGESFSDKPIVPPLAFDAVGTEATVNAAFRCVGEGSTGVDTELNLEAEGTVVIPDARLRKVSNGYEFVSVRAQTTLPLQSQAVAIVTSSVTCSVKTAIKASLGLTPQQFGSLPNAIGAREVLSFLLSNGLLTVTPKVGTALLALVDPLFTIGPGAAARWTSQFPCGDGPVGKTFCGTAGPFAPGDWVVLSATFEGDIPTADPTWRYQHAFVFDADGIAGNNYVPPAQYPKDFFAGTDKWYQLFYDPGKGFSVKVVDVRISSTNPVPSNARFVVAGNELAVFIPRSELNGQAPTYRVSTFRHQGDYGLNGGPVDLSYFPSLGKPLVPVELSSTVVVPE